MSLAHDALDLDVDATGRLFRIILVVGIVATQEHLMLSLAEHLSAQLLAHTQTRNHLAGHLRCAFEVVRCARRDVVAHEFLGNATAQENGKLIEHLVFGLKEVILGGKLHGVAKRLASCDDRNLMHGVRVLQDVSDKRVTALVIGNRGALNLGHHTALALRASNDALHGLFNLVHTDLILMTASGEQGGFVKKVRQVCTGKANGQLRELIKAHVGCQRLILGMNTQDMLTALDVRAVNRNLAIKTARTQQSRVQDIGAVGRSEKNHALALFKTIHLNQQLIERLLALVVAAAQASTALTSHGVDLVDKDDGRGLRLGLFKEVAHARCAHANEHLNEVGAGNAKERHAGLAGNGLGEQRLTGTRRANQQNAARNLCAKLAITLRLNQEVANLLELFDRLVDAGDIGELDLGARGLVGLCVGFTKLHVLVVGAHHLTHEVNDDDDEHHARQGVDQHIRPEVGIVGIHDVRGL